MMTMATRAQLRMKEITSPQAQLFLLIGPLSISFFMMILYKQIPLATIALASVFALGLLKPGIPMFVLSPLSIAAFLYTFMSTGTAVLVSPTEGLYRNIQFLLIIGSAIGFVKYRAFAPAKLIKNYDVLFVKMCWVVYINLVIFHLSTGKILTWKYLYDTKTMLSICTVLVFVKEDFIRSRFGLAGWCAALAVFGAGLLMSGERKAYLLFAVLFLFSRVSLFTKVFIACCAVASLLSYVSVAPEGDYIARQLNTIFEAERSLHISEFYSIEGISDQSSLIRDFVNRNAQEKFWEHPIIGLGATGYQAWSRQFFGATIQESAGLSMNVHGEINRVPAEGGIIGITIVLTYVGLLILALYRWFFRPGTVWTSEFRTPLYVFFFLISYMSYEAQDTLMITMCLFFGLEMARLQALTQMPSSSGGSTHQANTGVFPARAG